MEWCPLLLHLSVNIAVPDRIWYSSNFKLQASSVRQCRDKEDGEYPSNDLTDTRFRYINNPANRCGKSQCTENEQGNHRIHLV
jgi:hypothetical protein